MACTLIAAAGRLGVGVAVEAEEGRVVKRGGCGDEVGEYGSKSDKSTERFPLVGMVYSSKLVRACVGNRREVSRGRVGMTSPLVTASEESPKLANQRGRAIRNTLILYTLVSLAALLCVSRMRERARGQLGPRLRLVRLPRLA